jgi:hypothetical protein
MGGLDLKLDSLNTTHKLNFAPFQHLDVLR